MKRQEPLFKKGDIITNPNNGFKRLIEHIEYAVGNVLLL